MCSPTATDTDRLSKLTEGQKECLRLVYQHRSSKDIARDLGISPHTVDARLRAAMRVLGATNRIEAALQLAAHEAGKAYQPSVYQSSYVAPATSSSTIAPATDESTRRDERINLYPLPHAREQSSRRVAEAVAHFDLGNASMFGAKRPALRLWGARNDLTPLARLGAVMAIAIGSALAFGAILSGLASLARLT